MKSLLSFDLLSTGIAAMDKILGGGFSFPGLVEIWGPAAAGKSRFAHQIASTNLKDHIVFWLDTDRTFRIELIKRNNRESLSNLKYALVPSLDILLHTLDILENYESVQSIIIIDSLTGLVRSEIVNISQRNRLVMSILRKLKYIAANTWSLVFLINQVTGTMNGETALGGSLLKQQMKYILGISKTDNDQIRIKIDSAAYFENKPEAIVLYNGGL